MPQNPHISGGTGGDTVTPPKEVFVVDNAFAFTMLMRRSGYTNLPELPPPVPPIEKGRNPFAIAIADAYARYGVLMGSDALRRTSVELVVMGLRLHIATAS